MVTSMTTAKISKTKNFARVLRFLYISLTSLHDYDMKMTNFTFYGGRDRKTTIFFFFLGI